MAQSFKKAAFNQALNQRYDSFRRQNVLASLLITPISQRLPRPPHHTRLNP